VSKLRGVNHIVLFTHDMELSVRFYQDILGLEVVRTSPRSESFERQYFFELGNGELFSLYELTELAPQFERALYSRLWPEPPSRSGPALLPQKLDHLAFDVPARDDLLWFRARLQAHGIAVSEVVERTKFLTSIYFYDPSGNPLEIATLDEADPEWEGYDKADWLRDDSPVPSLLATPSAGSRSPG
jgi:catechol 2,3-dioxygenase-like lactoylglutathione lyase family enzyme